MDLNLWVQGAAIAGGVLGLASFLSGRYTPRADALLTSDVEVLKAQMSIVLRCIEEYLPRVLHSPHTPKLDRLLDNYKSLEKHEVKELRGRLLQLINNPDEIQGNRAGAVILLAGLEIRYNPNELGE